MAQARPTVRRLAPIFALVTLGLVALLPSALHAQPAIPQTQGPTWSEPIEGEALRSSVAFGNVDNDSDLEIFIGTEAGKVYGFNPDGSPLSGWPVDVIGRVGSAPAIGDINGDGQAEVVITAGWGNPSGDLTTGGIWAFRANGKPLWHKETMRASATGLPAGVFASPVLVDLNGDSRLDVLAAAYDQNVYALNGEDGTPLFPNALPRAAGDRNGALIWLGDATWATPAVGDVDGDEEVDIVVTAATNADARLSYVYPGWNDQATVNACTRANGQKRACGMVAVFSNDGKLKEGWPQFIAGHTYDSSPALANLDNDRQLEIVTGNGWDPTFGDASQPFYLTIWNHDGSIVKRYDIDAVIFESAPAIGDITGDSRPEIVVGTNPFPNLTKANSNKIFAFDANLNLLPGFPVESRDAQFNRMASPGAISLADVNEDGKADILFGTTWDVRAINGSGQYLNTHLALHGTGPFSGQPAVGDIDNDGDLELVYASSRARNPGVIHKYDLSVSAPLSALPWAQFHGNGFHTGHYAPPDLLVPPELGFISAGADRTATIVIDDTVGGGLRWSATASAGWIKLGRTSGFTGEDDLPVTLDYSAAPFNNGVASGTIRVTSDNLVKTIAVRLVEVDEVRAELFLPIVR